MAGASVPRRTILHVDMDAFFASVEIRDRPDLRGKPVLVGGAGKRGVVAAASYPARAFGCRSAMPMAVALRACPHAVVVPPRFEAYAEASRRAFEVFDRFSPIVEGLSIDEAFLDLTGSRALLGPPRQAAQALREEVARATGGLTCSVGISAVKFISKIASASCKPDGVLEVEVGRETEFLHPLPIRDLWGVGPKTATRLQARGIENVGDLARVDAAELVRWFGEHGAFLHRLAQGVDARAVELGRVRKSISHEDTFADDLVGVVQLRRQLLAQATRVADRLVARGLLGRHVHLKIRDDAFKTETRQCTLDPPSQQASEIYRVACTLLDQVTLDGRRFRLTGVGVSGLRDRDARGEQLEMFSGRETPAVRKADRLQQVLSAVRARFGGQALFPAASRRPGERDEPS